MPRNSTIIEVLIASPSDVAEERDVIERVIHRWNAAHARAAGISLQPVRWETHTHPEMGDRPQGVVNRQMVDDADMLIGVFCTKLGTQTGEAPSGTAEEIERFRRAGKKVLIYFSSVAPLNHFDVREYQRLLDYKQLLAREGLYGTYLSPEDLRDKLTGHLARVVNDIHPTQPALRPLAQGPDPSAQRAAMSRGPLNRILAIEAKWEAERTSSYGNATDGKQWMAEVTEILAQLIASRVVRDNDAALAHLRNALRMARDIEHWPLTYDSVVAFWQEGATLIEELKDILEGIGRVPEPTAPVTREPNSNPDPASSPKLTARLDGGFFDSGQRHAVFTIQLKNQSSSVTFEDIRTKLEVENPSQAGDWLEFHPSRWPMAWDDLLPRPDERHERGFSFPSNGEAQTGRSFEDFLHENVDGLFDSIALPHPAEARTMHTYYKALRPFVLRIRFTVEYLPALDGAKAKQLVQYYTLSPLCEARQSRIHEPEHPNIITGWKLSPVE